MPRARASVRREEALAAFTHVGNFVSCERFGSGHINETYLAVADTGKRYILQRINNAIFTDLKGIMGNILAVSEHIREIVKNEGGDPERATLRFLYTNWGKRYYRDSNNDGWRMYEFVEDTVAKDRVSCTEEFYACGVAFGRFQGWLSDFDADQLIEPIPDFHNTPVRYENLMKAVREDAVGRVAEAKAEIEFAMQRADFVHVLERAYQSGELPLRVTHNDTKLNNILFDTKTQKPVCVIDLDTVMPGFSVNDFGDAIRFGANTAAEDETDLSKVSLDLELYNAFAKGFLKGCNGKLTEKEIELMPIGARMMTFECGMRFLTDYLQGDTYFRTEYDQHNLDRCRCQFALVADMEKKEAEMKLN